MDDMSSYAALRGLIDPRQAHDYPGAGGRVALGRVRARSPEGPSNGTAAAVGVGE
jgi:tripartite-type tricarboxylate transporter receptor subunit TctC